METPPGTQPVVRVGRAPWVVAGAVLVVATAILLDPHVELGFQPAFLPTFFTLVIASDVLTCLVLVEHYRNGGDARVLALSWAYLWSAIVVCVHSMVFPGVWSETGLLGAVPSSAPWLWTAWHVGLPVLLGLALAPWPRRLEGRLAGPTGRRRALLVSWGVVAGLAALVCVACTAWAGSLPVIIDAGDYSVLTDTYGPWIAGANLLALVVASLGVLRRRSPGLERWALVALLASACDTSLVLLAHSRFTTGWYGARLMAVTAALVVLMSMLLAVARLHRQVAGYAHRLREQNVALHEAQRVRDRVLAVVSHDMRSPLTALHGYQQLLADGELGELSEDARDLARRSEAISRRLTLMTEDLVVAGSKAPVSLVPAALALPDELAVLAQGFPGLDLRLDCPAGLRVWADPLRLQQVLANLVGNAQKYGAEPVVLAASPDPGRGPGAVRITVGDAGAGVPPRFLPRLFEPYARAEGTGVHGTGLGLSVVRDLVERHGGSVAYEPGDRLFVVRLPGPPEAAQPADNPDTSSATRST
ncbi:MASE4 domain-containing protein [Nocardioides sp.]|uniref:sensor histidine kinase n=1 Tax=Nocardioides sp. TaxID=35761 RepID=UPI003515F8EB